MQISRPVVVFTSVVLLAGGVAAAQAVTETDPVMLCTNDKIVTVPKGDACGPGTTAFFVASDDDVRALADRVSEAEAALTALTNPTLTMTVVPDGLAPEGERFVLKIEGSGLRPGSEVHLSYENPHTQTEVDPVAADGTFVLLRSLPCDGPADNFRVAATTAVADEPDAFNLTTAPLSAAAVRAAANCS